MSTLTARDSIVFKSLFDPDASVAVEPRHAPPVTSLPGMNEQDFLICRSNELRILSPLQSGTKERGIIQRAINELSSLIQESPSYASAYVNRAQARRMLVPVDDLFTEAYADSTTQLFSDLKRGIELSESGSESGFPSEHQKTVLSTAYTHRGFLLLKLTDLVRGAKTVHGNSGISQAASAESIEEQASRDFASGGKYGNREAQDMAIRTNPYAKMCGAIVREALKKENEEWKAGQIS